VASRHKRNPIRNFLEYVAVRWCAVLLAATPERAAFRIGSLLGRILYYSDPKHRKIAERNLQHAFGGSRSPGWIRNTACQVYEHFGHSFAEIVQFRHKLRPDTIAKYFTFEGVENLRRAQQRGKGVIIVTGHIGNWESAGVAIAGAITPITSVARPLDNPLLDSYLVRARRTTGQRIVPKRGALRAMVNVLRSGGTMIVVGDQHAGADGIVVDFFGQPASTIGSVASLAVRFDAAIVPGYSRRVAPFRHCVQFDEPLLADRAAARQDEVRRLTEQFTKRLESYVRQCPDQWLWLHRRWRAAWPADTRRPASAGTAVSR